MVIKTAEIPWMRALTLTLADTNNKLLDLMRVDDPNAPRYCQQLKIQSDPDGGALKTRIGNSNLSDTEFGILLFATQVLPLQVTDEKTLIDCSQIYVRNDIAGKIISVVGIPGIIPSHKVSLE